MVISWRTLLIIVGSVFTALVLGVVAYLGAQAEESNDRQIALDPFYIAPNPIPSNLGEVIRIEPLDVAVPGGSAQRLLYVSERPDGSPAVSGAMIFIPNLPAPAGGRPVVAWEHGTLGMGDACVPSRSTNPLGDMQTWLGPMMAQGWVVIATDYVGLGTTGPNQYLIAQSEVRDIVNAVRAARQIPIAKASSRYVTWGHSQGGHSSVWAGHLSREYAPELELLGVAAAAPALNLPDIASAQWNTTVGWVIGSDLIESWPTFYPNLPVDSILTEQGRDASQRLSAECIKESALEALVREKLGQQFFATNPNDNAVWARSLNDQTPPPLPASMPMFMAQGTADQVVLPWPNAKVQEQWCAAGSDITVLWMGDINHQEAALTAGPAAVAWIADRFAGRPTNRSCDIAPPVAPVNPAG
jgi:alpha-beta hydrolase superfamily lysophospholipase